MSESERILREIHKRLGEGQHFRLYKLSDGWYWVLDGRLGGGLLAKPNRSRFAGPCASAVDALMGAGWILCPSIGESL